MFIQYRLDASHEVLRIFMVLVVYYQILIVYADLLRPGSSCINMKSIMLVHHFNMVSLHQLLLQFTYVPNFLSPLLLIVRLLEFIQGVQDVKVTHLLLSDEIVYEFVSWYHCGGWQFVRGLGV